MALDREGASGGEAQKKGRGDNREVWSFRPAPLIATWINGLVSSGEFRDRTAALNGLLSRSLETYQVDLSAEEEDCIRIPAREALQLASLFKQLLGRLDEKAERALLEQEFRALEERSQTLLNEQEMLERTVSKRKYLLSRTRSQLVIESLSKQIARDEARIQKLKQLLEKLDQRMMKLREQAEMLGREEEEDEGE